MRFEVIDITNRRWIVESASESELRYAIYNGEILDAEIIGVGKMENPWKLNMKYVLSYRKEVE